MRCSVATVLAVLFVHAPAFGQSETPPSPNPVEEQEVDASTKEQPKEGTGQPTTTSPLTASTAPRKDAKWDVNAPVYTTLKQVPIRTDEGTWMDLDVSPDGRTIVFTLLGDIYTLAIAGGTPRRIAEGLAWEAHPRFSPDGRRIAFTSDRGGGDNIWVMNADGSDKRQVTKEDFRLLNQPSWSPDGEYIVAKKHFTTQRSLGTGEIWIYHVSGGGGVKLVARASEELQKELGEPVYAPDGSAVYYTRDTTPGASFVYAQDSTQGNFAIERIDLKSGQVTTAVSGYGGAVRPQPSPDGKRISFIRRDKDKSELWVKDLSTGVERRLTGGLDLDLQETWAVHGTYPSMAWTPDSRSVVYWAGGKLRRIDAKGGESAVIPFRIDDTRQVADAPHPEIAVAPRSFETRMVKFATMDPDGSHVMFESLGKIWVKDAAGSRLTPLTKETSALELWPTYSRDGRQLAWVRWTDEGLGQIMVSGPGGADPRVVTRTPGHYAVPQFSPDGRTLVFEKRRGGDLVSPEYSEDTGIYRMSLASGEEVLVTRGNRAPQYGAANDRIFMLGQDKGKLQLLSTDLNGQDKRVHAVGELASDFRVSPDGRTLAFRQNYEVFAMPLLPGGQAVEVAEKASSLPVTQASKGGASYIGWANGGRTLTWSMGPVLYRADVATLFANAPLPDGAPRFAPPQTGISLARTIESARPGGTTVLANARILTMTGEGAGVIENGTIVISGDRISAVGAAGSVAVPAGARVIDMAGKTIMPGLVDAHAHGPQGQGDLVPQQNWSLVQQLALGTTTMHDPSSQASTIFAAAERQRAGDLLSPRLFSTAEIVYGARAPGVYARIDSYDDALQHIRRIKAQGGHSIKNYNQPRRDQRQMVARAALNEGMQVVAEGGSLFGMDMTIIADGNSTLEHNIPLEYFYEDLLQFYGGSQTNYTPTLVVTYGGLAGDPYWRQATDVFADPLLVHTPPRELLAATARRTKAPDWAFVDDDAAREAKKLAARGPLVSIGAHGQQAGIAAHWEMWSFVRGGMTAVEALRAATIVPARSLGMARDIGSLEPGKLADLIVLDADPSVDIRNSNRIARVMLGGRLYDARTMNEVGTGTAKRRPYYWER
ncbi:amidohydrolase family protein [Qipengyuania sediminis]|uniref:amidohydrolase family protein n=1 Tax=Qipengyuania sediminis TaxID=1532023 RepID=UPI00105A76D6|nr:amidohydrolase family protein [Qipengyuania sediminis]